MKNKSIKNLLKMYRPLVKSKLKKYFNFKEDFEDMYQDGMLEILLAIEEFDETKGVPFDAYLNLRLNYLYLNKYDNRLILSLESEMEKCSPEILEKTSFIDEGYQHIIDMDNYLELYEAYEKLTNREKQVVCLYYIKSKTMVEIADILGLSYRTVINTKDRAIKRLRKVYKI